MSYKIVIKKILGKNGTKFIKKIYQNCKYKKSIIFKYNNAIHTNYDYKVYQIKDKHVFFGYYDLQQINTTRDKLLAHVAKLDAVACQDAIEIYWIERATGAFHKIAESNAWCWQQGSRLRWYPLQDNCIVFNNVFDKNYCTEVWDIEVGKLIKRFSCACYDWTSDFKYGISLNFSRLQRLRPGYGYSSLADKSTLQYAPDNDGVFLFNSETGERKLIISLENLAEEQDSAHQYQHYINHISIAPNDKYFMFFHLWIVGEELPWKMELCVANLDGSKLRRLEMKDVISHYCWNNGDTLLVTTTEGLYYKYDVKTGNRYLKSTNWLICDGHPTYAKDGRSFFTDSYPLKYCMQHILRINDLNYEEIASIFSDPRLYGEKRCDLHPRVTEDNCIITVDSTLVERRCIIEFFDDKEFKRAGL